MFSVVVVAAVIVVVDFLLLLFSFFCLYFSQLPGKKGMVKLTEYSVKISFIRNGDFLTRSRNNRLQMNHFG